MTHNSVLADNRLVCSAQVKQRHHRVFVFSGCRKVKLRHVETKVLLLELIHERMIKPVYAQSHRRQQSYNQLHLIIHLINL